MMHKRQRCTLWFPAVSLRNVDERTLHRRQRQRGNGAFLLRVLRNRCEARMTKCFTERRKKNWPTKDFIKLATAILRSVHIVILSSACINDYEFIFIEIWTGTESSRAGVSNSSVACMIVVSLFVIRFGASDQRRHRYQSATCRAIGRQTCMKMRYRWNLNGQ